MKIVIHGLSNLKEDEKEKIRTALKMGEEVLSSENFANRILALKFKGTTKKPSDVLGLILSGSDNGKADEVIDINIEGFFKWNSTVGYTYLHAAKTYINRRFLRKFTHAEVFGHIMHELMHRMGFAHKDSVDRKFDVAYLVGYASRNAFEAYYKNPPVVSFANAFKPIEFVCSLLICWNVFGQNVCFVGDTGRGTADQYKVVKAMAFSGCKTVFHLGDVIYEKGISSAEDPLLLSRFMAPNALLFAKGVPFYMELGNHDYAGNELAWLEVAKKYPLVKYPKQFHEVKIGDYCFVGIDLDFGGKEQKQFVDKKRDCIRVAYGHYPYKSSGEHGNAWFMRWFFLKRHIFGQYDFYVSGHDHQLSDEGVFDGTRQLISGAGASTRILVKKPKIWGSSQIGFLLLDTDTHQWHFIDEKNHILHSFGELQFED